MIDPREIIERVNPRIAKVLTIGQAILPEGQFKAFRKLVLDEFGRNGLETEIYDLIGQHEEKRNG